MTISPIGWRSAPSTDVGQVLVSSRSLAEYVAMFNLTETDLTGRVLDCPGGASSFVAETTATGVTALACDPIYGSEPDQLSRQAEADRLRAEGYVHRHPDEYSWTYFASPAGRTAERSASLELFTQDYRSHPDRYVPATLPQLPFADDSFDLVLCSHFLFAYADRFDLAFHAASLIELVRVSTGDVRVYPVFPMGSAAPLDLLPLRELLDEHGIVLSLKRVDYQFQRGEPVMLTCSAAVRRR